MPGLAAVAGNRAGTLHEGAFGRRGLDRPDPMTPDTLAWIASMTKAITTVAALQQVEAGRLASDAADRRPVGRAAARPSTSPFGARPWVRTSQRKRSRLRTPANPAALAPARNPLSCARVRYSIIGASRRVLGARADD